MSLFDQAYDMMSWKEICYRLPGELAVSALKRRVTNLDTLKMFFDNVGQQPSSIKPLKEHVNSVLSGYSIDDTLAAFDETYHPTLFNWLDQNNIKKFKESDPAKLSLKFLFNITDSKDQASLEAMMDKILAEQEVEPQKIRSILRKASDTCLAPLLEKIIKDARPEVRVNILAVPGTTNKELVNDLQKTIGLKALAKCASSQPIGAVSVLSMNLFAALKPLERIEALEKYLNYFPKFRKVPAFEPEVSQEEFDMILFAGCMEQNERVNKIIETYKQITQMDPPKDEEEQP